MKRRHLRRAVLERDRGCCQLCGLDTADLFSAYRAARGQAYGSWRYERSIAEMTMAGVPVLISISQRHRGEIRAIEDRLRRLGFTPGKSFGECDHIQPLEEGGPDTLENARWLCVPCHRRATAEHAARRARRPSKGLLRRVA